MSQNNISARPRSQNIRQRFQRDLIIIIVMVCVITLAVAAFLASGVKKNLSTELINRSSIQAIKELKDVFGPLRKDLAYTRQWGISGQIDPAGDIGPLIGQFIPMLRQNSFISAMMIANSKGQESMLLRDEANWLTRSTDGSKHSGKVLWKSWSNKGDLLKEWWEDSDYDPRQRPWFKGALSAPDEENIYWTEPYTFFTKKEPGISVSTNWQKDDDVFYVAGFDILLKDIGTIFKTLTVTKHGTVILVEKDRSILAPFVLPAGPQELEEADRPSHPDDTPANIATINAYKLWHSQAEPEAPFRFNSSRETWWSGFRPLDPDTQEFWIGVVVPESDFIEASNKRVYRILAVALSILGVALLLSYLLVRKYGRQLKDRPVHGLDEGILDDNLRTLIDQGESDTLEFKSTMRMNLKTGKPGKEIELAWLKTVIAFFNTNGGTLLIGVDDNGTILGLEADKFDNDDKCRLHFKNLISQHIGLEFSEFIEFDLKSTEGKTIAVIYCSRANAPVFLKHGKHEDFFIRSGPSSLKLSVSQVLKYLKQQ
jgi:hypothetical protein